MTSTNDPGKIAKTNLGRNGRPDHTTYSDGGIRRSFDSDRGQNIRNDHYSENGPYDQNTPVFPNDPSPFDPSGR